MPRRSRTTTVLLATILVLSFTLLGVAPASAAEPWWQVETGARPTNLWTAVNETQELFGAPAGQTTVVKVGGVKVACLGSNSGCTAEGMVESESAGELRSALEEPDAYGSSGVKVTETPASSGDFTIVSSGAMAGRWVPPLETTSAGASVKVLVEGGSGRVVLTITNLGDAPVQGSSSPVTVADRLPAGMRAYRAEAIAGMQNRSGPVQCTVAAGGATEVSCTLAHGLPEYEAIEIELWVGLTAPLSGASGEVSVSGGGAAGVSVPQTVTLSSEKVRFGIESFSMRAEEEGGDVSVQAGSHPFQLTTGLQLNAGPVEPGKNHSQATVEQPALPRNFRFPLPAGLVGNPNAFPKCTYAQFTHEHNVEDDCSAETAIGVASVTIIEAGPLGFVHTAVPVFNLEPGFGEPARFGFMAVGVPVTIDTALDANDEYRISAISTDTPELAQVLSTTVTFWGNPGDPRHDSARGWHCVYALDTEPCTAPASHPSASFLRLPVSCASTLSYEMELEPWDVPLGSEIQRAFTAGEPLLGCSRVPFNPGISASLTSKLASNPSGLGFELELPNSGLENPAGIAETEPKKVEVDLPEGVSVNPSEAEGLAVCTEAQYKAETVSSHSAEGCPEASKIGSVLARSPLVEGAIEGSVYLAAPHHNPFDSLLALYVVARLPEKGLLVKQAGVVEPDPNTGQLRTTFDALPQLPYSTFQFHFREGARAPLVTPAVCGTYQTVAKLVPYSAANLQEPQPSEIVERTSSFTVEHGAGGGACPSGGVTPFHPGLVAGTLNNAAGHYSPFDLQIFRNDAEQEITRFSIKMPQGLTGNLSGIPFCPEAAIAAAQARKHDGGGSEEQEHPSCPASSEIGHTLVGAGVGSVLVHAPGKLYLAGPYHGAPLSVVAVTSAVVGPFDLGTVVVREGLQINRETAEVSIDPAGSDPIPHIIDGIPVHIREIHVYVDRSNFILNPTNCQPANVSSTVVGSGADFASETDDQPYTVSTRFQAADCASLKFSPSFKASTSGKTSRANGASLHVALAYPKDAFGQDTNIHSVKVELPKQLPSRLTTLQKACTSAQFETDPAGCPAASRVGTAKAITPILPVPLEGPAYFVSHGGAKFPELVIVLQGYGLTIDLRGETFISDTGITSSTFHTVPDQPVQSFELTLPQGPDSALAANGNLCQITKTVIVKKKVTVKSKGHARTVTRKVKQTVPASLVMPTTFTAQNGTVLKQSTQIEVTGCAKHKAKKANAARRAKRHRGNR